MSMQDEKLERFSSAVDCEVDSKIEGILAEAVSSREKMIEKAQDNCLYEAYDRIKDEMKKIISKYIKLYSKAELESKKEILLYREKLAEQVFDNVKVKFIEFTNSDTYKDYLVKLAIQEIKNFPEEKTAIIYVSKKDMKFAEDILSAIGSNYSVEEKASIKLGGIAIYFENLNIQDDKTLDSALESQRDVFNHSNSLKLS